MSTKDSVTDVLIVGSGLAGLTMAAALANSGLKTKILTPRIPKRTKAKSFNIARTTALLQASTEFLSSLGVWQHISDRATPLKRMRLIDDRLSRDKPIFIEFNPAEVSGDRELDVFGQNIANEVLENALLDKLSNETEYVEGSLVGLDVGQHYAIARTDKEQKLKAKLIIAADGSNSKVRELARIDFDEHVYDQTALTFVLKHSKPHENISTEFQKNDGPLTLVPSPNELTSVVWVNRKQKAEKLIKKSKDFLSRELERETHGILGDIEIVAGPGRFPVVSRRAKLMVKPRVALIAETAHAMPPIGAQGLNSSIMDVAWLSHFLNNVQDPGALSVLKRYENTRKTDVLTRFSAVNALNKMVVSKSGLVTSLRQTGLRMTGHSETMRQFFIKHGMMWADNLPPPQATKEAA